MKKMFVILTALLVVVVSIYWRLDNVWQWGWGDLLRDPDELPMELAITKMAVLPQMAVAFLAGGLLALASSALQQIVRNNLASDSTLAVGSGAQLALMMVTIFAPSAGLFGSFGVAFVGSIVAMLLVLMIAKSSRMDPVTVILGGLIVNIIFGAVAAVIVLFYNDFLLGIMVWGSGSLLQDGWTTTLSLCWLTLGVFVVFGLLFKPLTLLSLDDEQAHRLGVPVKGLRYTVLVLAAVATAFVVSKVGIIGFVGLAGASCASLLGVRQFVVRLLVSFGCGGLLLLLSDNLFSVIGQYWKMQLPTGTLTSVFGVPLLIYLVLLQRKTLQQKTTGNSTALLSQKTTLSCRLTFFWFFVLVIAFIFLLGFAPNTENDLTHWGFHWDWALIEQHRLPRALSAVATGAMLAVGGALLQILTRNPMASPEVLGVSSGASLAVVIAFLALPTFGDMGLFLSGVSGGFFVLLVIMMMSRKLPPSSLLLVGIAVGALSGSVLSVIQLSGNPRLTAVLGWLSGTTYYAKPERTLGLVLIAILLISIALLFIKPLRLLSLGSNMATHLGLTVKRTQNILLVLVALLSAASTLAVGPLSFIGLMTPHLAKRLGAITPDKQLPVAALLGAGLMLFADWLGRYIIFPYEIGAGTIASLIGGGYFFMLMRKTR